MLELNEYYYYATVGLFYCDVCGGEVFVSGGEGCVAGGRAGVWWGIHCLM